MPNLLTTEKLYHGLSADFGLDGVQMSADSTTATLRLVTPNGSPLLVGWFDNSKKSLREPNSFALTKIPIDARHKDQRLTVTQYPQSGAQDLAVEDWYGYLEGYDHLPNIQRRRASPEEADAVLRGYALGALVLHATAAHELEVILRATDTIGDFFAYTRSLVANPSSHISTLTGDTLDRYAAAETIPQY